MCRTIYLMLIIYNYTHLPLKIISLIHLRHNVVLQFRLNIYHTYSYIYIPFIKWQKKCCKYHPTYFLNNLPSISSKQKDNVLINNYFSTSTAKRDSKTRQVRPCISFGSLFPYNLRLMNFSRKKIAQKKQHRSHRDLFS